MIEVSPPTRWWWLVSWCHFFTAFDWNFCIWTDWSWSTNFRFRYIVRFETLVTRAQDGSTHDSHPQLIIKLDLCWYLIKFFEVKSFLNCSIVFIGRFFKTICINSCYPNMNLILFQLKKRVVCKIALNYRHPQKMHWFSTNKNQIEF